MQERAQDPEAGAWSWGLGGLGPGFRVQGLGFRV